MQRAFLFAAQGEIDLSVFDKYDPPPQPPPPPSSAAAEEEEKALGSREGDGDWRRSPMLVIRNKNDYIAATAARSSSNTITMAESSPFVAMLAGGSSDEAGSGADDDDAPALWAVDGYRRHDAIADDVTTTSSVTSKMSKVGKLTRNSVFFQFAKNWGF